MAVLAVHEDDLRGHGFDGVQDGADHGGRVAVRLRDGNCLVDEPREVRRGHLGDDDEGSDQLLNVFCRRSEVAR